MKCNICDKEVTGGTFGTMAGFICHDPKCKAKADKDRKAFLAREWEPTEIKDAVELNESLCLFAHKWIEQLKKSHPGYFDKLRENNPLMTIPEHLCLDFTEKVLNVIPREYYESQNARGHERMFHGGTFRLLKPIPKEALITALIKAQIIKSWKKD